MPRQSARNKDYKHEKFITHFGDLYPCYTLGFNIEFHKLMCPQADNCCYKCLNGWQPNSGLIATVKVKPNT